MENKRKGMKKRTYLIVWTLIFALILGTVGAGNAIAIYWDSALTIFFGEMGGSQVSEGSTGGSSIYYASDYASADERTAASAAISDRIVAEGTVLLNGHFHVPVCREHQGYLYLNPGSVSIPKEGKPGSYLVLEGKTFTWKDLDGKAFEPLH